MYNLFNITDAVYEYEPFTHNEPEADNLIVYQPF